MHSLIEKDIINWYWLNHNEYKHRQRNKVIKLLIANIAAAHLLLLLLLLLVYSFKSFSILNC